MKRTVSILIVALVVTTTTCIFHMVLEQRYHDLVYKLQERAAVREAALSLDKSMGAFCAAGCSNVFCAFIGERGDCFAICMLDTNGVPLKNPPAVRLQSVEPPNRPNHYNRPSTASRSL